ncbi:MAG: FtsH protease activity modulator HflK [Paenibacillaceae bacterium]
MSVFDEQRPKSVPPELPPGLIRKIIIGVIILVVVLFGFSMFYTVEEGQRGAILTFGKFTGESESGLHFKMPYPIQKVIILDANITQRMSIGYRETGGGTIAVPEESMMITGDENIVSADAVVEWKIADIEKYLFNIDNPDGVFLRNAAIASIRTVMGSNKLDYAITEGKTKIQGDVRAKLVELMDKYNTGITIIDLKFQDIEPPEGEVQQAFRDVTNAREEKNTKINNANKYKNDRLPKARGEAQALIEQAEAQKKSRILNAVGDVAQFNAIYNEYVKNPAVTERRLILETLEKVLPNAQIFITDSAGDTVKYLPINEMLKPSTKAPVIEAPTQAPTTGGTAQ